MKKLILGAALAALTVTSFADPNRICAMGISGMAYDATVSIVSNGNVVAHTGRIAVGQGGCLNVPKLSEGASWYVVDKAHGLGGQSVNCSPSYTYNHVTNTGTALFQMWGTIWKPHCGRAS